MASILGYAQSPQVTDVINLDGGSMHCPDINNVDCGSTTGHLNPIAGNPYTYIVDVTPDDGTAPNPKYTWFVTDNDEFITASVLQNDESATTYTADDGSGSDPYIMDVGVGYNDDATGTNEITIRWKSWTTEDPVFLVIHVEGEDGCTDNIQAWKIEPVNQFTLDLANIDEEGQDAGANFATCVSPVVSAIYDGTSDITMDYGVNYLYFTVSAANYADAWQPSVELTGYTGSGSIAVDWAYSANAESDANWNSMTLASGVYESAAADFALSPDYADDDDASINGDCIVIRVTIDHDTDESLTDQTIELAVDGEMFIHDGTNFVTQGNDVHYADWTDFTAPYTGECGTEDGFENDRATQILEARPTIEENTPGADTFVPKN